MTRPRRRAAVALAAAAALGLALPALATHSDQGDPNDANGRLDLRAVTFEHEDAPPRWTFLTFDRWTIRAIWDRGSFVVEFDTLGDEAVDYVAVVRSDGRRLRGELLRVRSDGREVRVGAVPSGKDGGRSAWVTVGLRKLSFGRSRTSYFWSATSILIGASCRRTCFDRVPDSGMVEQLLPGVTPSPTPSPTGSPSPTPSPSPSPSPSPRP